MPGYSEVGTALSGVFDFTCEFFGKRMLSVEFVAFLVARAEEMIPSVMLILK
jgi:hypothetical protein